MFYCGISDEAGRGIAQQIAAHKALGWTHLELRLIDGVNLTDVDDAVFDRVVGAVEDAGMTVACFASQLGNWSRPITGNFDLDVQELRRAIPRMHRLGTKFIRCMTWVQDAATMDEWRDEAVRRLQVLAKMAEGGGIILVHENCTGWGGEAPEHGPELLRRVGSPALKWVFDTGNPLGHGQNAVEVLRAVLDDTIHVHIKDSRRDGEKVAYTYPGEGDNDVAECLRILIRSGYDGIYSIEPHLASIVHTGDLGGADRDKALWDSYIEYGRRLMALYAKVEAEVKASA